MPKLVAFAVLALAACDKAPVRAKVDCEVVQGPAVDCTVKETESNTRVEVCWDFKVRCDSGATLDAARTCVTVQDGETTKTTIPMEKLTVTGKCSGNKTGSLANMTIDGTPPR